MFKKLLLSIIMLLSFVSYAQNMPDDIEGKKVLYEQASKKIRELEDKAQYFGDDPVVRERLGLPPKMLSFEEWRKNPAMNQPSSEKQLADEKKTQDSNPVGDEKLQIDPAKPEQNSGGGQTESGPSLSKENTNSNSVAAQKPGYQWSEKEKNYIAATFFGCLLLNFVIYNLLISGRYLFIATPFDLAARKYKSDAPKVTNWKRFFIEFLLLIIVLFLLPFGMNEGKVEASESILEAVVHGLTAYAILHIGYVIVHGLWGASSRCPKCKNSFAARMQTSWDEARLTYNKKFNSASSKEITFEKGVRHSEYTCAICGHQWQRQAQYEKQLTY